MNILASRGIDFDYAISVDVEGLVGEWIAIGCSLASTSNRPIFVRVSCESLVGSKIGKMRFSTHTTRAWVAIAGRASHRKPSLDKHWTWPRPTVNCQKVWLSPLCGAVNHSAGKPRIFEIAKTPGRSSASPAPGQQQASVTGERATGIATVEKKNLPTSPIFSKITPIFVSEAKDSMLRPTTLCRATQPLRQLATSTPITPVTSQTIIQVRAKSTINKHRLPKKKFIALREQLAQSASGEPTAVAAAPKPKPAPAPQPRGPPPFVINRTASQNLPIYLESKRGGNKKLTLIRKLEGDRNVLAEWLAEDLGLDRKQVRVKAPTNHVELEVRFCSPFYSICPLQMEKSFF